jgi:glutamine synthetase
MRELGVIEHGFVVVNGDRIETVSAGDPPPYFGDEYDVEGRVVMPAFTDCHTHACFAGDRYGGLSDLALHYIGGIIKHARAINAFTNSTTNSYKRLVPGFEAPIMLAYSARNRSASIRIPWVSNPRGRRIEVRFPDPLSNPYFAFAALMMAGLDGIKNKIDPGPAMDKDLYDLEPEEAKHIPTVCHSLDMALDALDRDREFLKAGGVFTDDMIDAYIALKMEEVTTFRMTTHPVEFQMYYSC